MLPVTNGAALLVERFRESLLARSAGEGTIRAHVEGVTLFYRRFPGLVSEWNKHHVRTFLANRKWKTNTRRIRWKALNTYAVFLVAEGIIPESFMGDVPCPPAGPARRPPMLTDEDFALLLKCCPHWTWIGLRNQAILWTLWTTPFRKSEFAALEVRTVNFNESTIWTPKSKNGEPYGATLFPSTAAAIKDYLDKRPYKTEPALWVTDQGEPLTPAALTLTLQRIEKRAQEAGLEKHIYFHAFRHNFGMNTVRWGLSTVETARSMGQKSEKAAAIYTQWVAAEEAQKKIRRVARLG